MLRPCYHSCMLPNETLSITSWLMMSHGFSWIYYHIACRLCREITWSQSRDLIFRTKSMFTIMWNPRSFYVVDRLLSDIKMNNDYFVTSIAIELEHAIFPRGRVPHQKWHVINLDNYSVHINRTSRDWLEEHGMRRMRHQSDWSNFVVVTSTCFLWSKKNSNGFRWLTKNSFWVSARDFEVYWSRRIERRISNLDVAGLRSKSREWRSRQMINKFHLDWFCLISSDGAGHIFIDEMILWSEASERFFVFLEFEQSMAKNIVNTSGNDARLFYRFCGDSEIGFVDYGQVVV
jgi:hypothetical protein